METVSRKELLIFLTPTVLATAEDAEMHDANELSLMEIPGRTRAEMLRLDSVYDRGVQQGFEDGMIEIPVVDVQAD